MSEFNGDKKLIRIYENISEFLHIVKNRKILLMSGTPMKDQPNEIADIMNLILPKEEQFDRTTFEENYLGKDENTKKFGEKIAS